MVISKQISLFNATVFGDDDSGVPTHTQIAIDEYILNGWEPSGFLTAVIKNDLFRVVYVADTANIQRLPQIVKWLMKHVPASAIGSQEAIDLWVNDADGRRTNFVDRKLKAKMWERLHD